MARVENLYLFAGNNEWEKGETLRTVLGRLSPEGPSFVEYDVIEGKDKALNLQKILADLLIIPFTSRYHLTLFKDVEKTPPTFQTRLLEAVTHLPRRTVCVLETKETTLRGGFFEKVESLAKVLLFKTPSGPELLLWLERRAAFYQKKISPAARELLLEKVGGALLALDKALEALAAYVGESSFIEEKEVEMLLGTSLASTSFELARAVASRKALEALSIISRLLSNGERPHEIVGVLGWQLRRMLLAKELLEEGVAPTEVGRNLRLRWQEEKIFFESLSRFERSELEKGLTLLLQLDQHLKTGIGGGEEVEQFILGLCR